jgi:hypothetical protein
VEEQDKQETVMIQAASKAPYFSETSVNFQRTAQPYIPEDRTLHNQRPEVLKSDQFTIFSK